MEALALSPPEITARVREVGERFLAISEVVHVLRELQIDADRLRALDARALVGDNELRLLLHMAPTSAEYARTLARIEEVARSVEVELIAIDELVPSSTFRHLLYTTNVTPLLLLQYARLIARHFRADARHTERLTSLVLRMLTLPKLDGTRELRPRKDTEDALAYIVRESHAPDPVRQSALEFLAAAKERARALEKIDEIFGGGFYLDVLGYQVSLRDSMLDVEILRASAELSAMVWNRLVSLMKREGVSLADLYVRLGAVEDNVARVFLSLEPEEPQSIAHRFELRREREEIEKKQSIELLKPRHGMRLLVAAVVAIALGLGAGMMRRTSRNENEMVPVAQTVLAQISPVLESATTSKGEAMPILFAQVTPSKWTLMDADARRETAWRLAAALLRQKMSGALVYDGSVMVIQIAAGNVMFVQ